MSEESFDPDVLAQSIRKNELYDVRSKISDCVQKMTNDVVSMSGCFLFSYETLTKDDLDNLCKEFETENRGEEYHWEMWYSNLSKDVFIDLFYRLSQVWRTRFVSLLILVFRENIYITYYIMVQLFQMNSISA